MLPGDHEDHVSGGTHVRGPRHLQRSRRGRHTPPSFIRTGLRLRPGLRAGPRIGAGLTTGLKAGLKAAWPAATRLAAHRRTAVVAVVAAVVLSSTLTASVPGPGAEMGSGVAFTADDDRVAAAENGVSRDHRRPNGRKGVAPSKAAPKPSAAASGTQAPSPLLPTVNARPAPVGGLTEAEMGNAVAVIDTGRKLGLPRRAFVVAITTALQESHLRNLANANLPQSLQHPNEGVGYDYDSVGLFQQRPNWGTVEQLMNPGESARKFYSALVRVQGWEQMAVTVAAQTVQVSAFPDAYAKHQPLAEQVVTAVVGP